MSWAVRKKLIRGYEDGSYRPEALITREEMCVILDRLMQQRGETLHTGKLSFADTASISVWARDSVARMTALGLIRGAENNRFFPHDHARRGCDGHAPHLRPSALKHKVPLPCLQRGRGIIVL